MTKKVLVIDDSRVIRMRVREMMPQEGLELLEARDGVEGMNMIREHHPNLVLLDFILPKMGGWEVFQKIQQDPQLQTMALVVMSGRKEEVVEKVPEPFDYFSFVAKPFEKNELFEAIRQATRLAAERAKRIPTAPVKPVSADMEARVRALETEVAQLKAELQSLRAWVQEHLSAAGS
ncbi:MAG: response regulator [Gloeomargarita sp. SKYBB_i_bin120]|nr:response regulator [Gloeomargarita sp. SKYG98]MCS7293321.1 response regulator [Gloeomargarita sp. SKYB120]MDW8178886.1 response regulator [Gloeomargarita sp. SKYBB_i_bin120]